MNTAFADAEAENLILSAAQSARWVVNLLREYSSKLIEYNQRCHDVHGKLLEGGYYAKQVAPLDAVRLICLYESIHEAVEAVIRQGSGLIEHAHLAHENELELKLRLDETEEHYRFSKLLANKLADEVQSRNEILLTVRTIMKKNHIESAMLNSVK